MNFLGWSRVRLALAIIVMFSASLAQAGPADAEYCDTLGERLEQTTEPLRVQQLADELEARCGLSRSEVSADVAPGGGYVRSYCHRFRCDDALFPDLYCNPDPFRRICGICGTMIGGYPGMYCSNPR